MRHLPNAVTIFRIVLTPAVLVLLFTPGQAARLWALGLFVIASISDYLDGRLARDLNLSSRLGKLLDPAADKVLVLGTFIGLAWLMPDVVSFWGVAIIAGRDLAVTILRSRSERQGRSLTTSSAAKWKTAAQLTFLILVLAIRPALGIPVLAGIASTIVLGPSLTILFWIVVAITVWTGILYFRKPDYDRPSAA